MKLVQTQPSGDPPRSFELSPSQTMITLGCSSFARLQVPAGFWVGHHHCGFRESAGGWLVCDLGSPRPTLLNGRSLRDAGETPLEPGAELTCGRLVFRVEA